MHDHIFKSKLGHTNKHYQQLECYECLKLTNKMLKAELKNMIEGKESNLVPTNDDKKQGSSHSVELSKEQSNEVVVRKRGYRGRNDNLSDVI